MSTTAVTRPWSQSKRLENLAEQIGWKGKDLSELAEFLTAVFPALPDSVRSLMEDHYIHNKQFDKLPNGKADVTAYQRLYEGRVALQTLVSLNTNQIQVIEQYRSAGKIQ